jgi:diguanylate cyclase (GGDEF)-like protein
MTYCCKTRLFAMVNSVAAIAIALSFAAAAEPPPPLLPLTTLRAVRAITNAEASKHNPVAFAATVSYFRRTPLSFYAQDGDSGIYIELTKDIGLTSGDRVLVRGTMKPSFSPIVESNNVTVLSHGEPLKPEIATYSGLVHQKYLCRLVTIRTVVRSADLRFAGNLIRSTYLHLLTDDGTINATVENSDRKVLNDLLDAEVEVTGVAAIIFDSKMQQTGIMLHSSSMDDIKILKRAKVDPWTLPVTPSDEFFLIHKVSDHTPRVRIHGTITYDEPGVIVVLQNGANSVWIDSATDEPLSIGDVADATGFPDVRDGFLKLAHGEVKDSHVRALIAPHRVTWHDLATHSNVRFGHNYDLVSIEGQVVTEAREDEQDQYILNSDGHLFSAIFRHSDMVNKAVLPPLKMIPLGSKVRVAGICVEQRIAAHANDQYPVPFDILLRNFDDIAVVSNPSLLNVRNLLILVGLLLAVVFVAGARGWVIERRVRRQTAATAYVERRRGRILEDINGSRPLTEIIDQITELVSFGLKGGPCWCQIAGGARIGNCPEDLSGMRVVRREIPARSGPPLGEVFAAFDPLTKPRAVESESLALAVGLAALAIETRRLYTDLIRRSEFDLLTDIHNRFSLDKHLDTQIEEAYQRGGIFGLIYIDLDNFKKVNDLLGHRIGDLYLQEMALRMKRQLRSVDTLARLGGDEFAILVPLVRSRADVKEIALRLEHCFDEPLSIEGVTLHPAASVGFALYPEDATTKDGLLSIADDAMYKSKNAKRPLAQTPAAGKNSEPELKVRS